MIARHLAFVKKPLEAIIIVPPRKDAVISTNIVKCKSQGDGHLERIKTKGRFVWKRSSGLAKQSHVENALAPYKKTLAAGFTPNEKTRRKEKYRLDAAYSTECLD